MYQTHQGFKKTLFIFLILNIAATVFSAELKLKKWKTGDVITTPEKRKLKVVNVIEDGHKAVVYKVEDGEGSQFALKVPISSDPDILRSLKKEPEKIPDLDASGVEYAEIFEHGSNYMVKEWVNGTRGDQWFKEWQKRGADSKDLVFQQLLETFHSLADKGIYIGNLKPLNIIFDGKKWVVVDPGSIDLGMGRSKALKEFEKTLTDRWKVPGEVAKEIYKYSSDSSSDSEDEESELSKKKSGEYQKTKDKMSLNDLREGARIKTPAGKKLKLKKYIDTGRRGVVWKAEDSDGKEFAVKIARSDTPENLKSIAEEPDRTQSVKDVGVPIAGVVEAGKNYLIKEWLNGERGDEWFKRWVKGGASSRDERFKKLMDLFKDLANREIYIGDLNRKNLVWDSHRKEWLVIESGRAHSGQDPKKTLLRYKQRFYDLWTRDVDCPKLIKMLGLKRK